jgi:hypothetical protein
MGNFVCLQTENILWLNKIAKDSNKYVKPKDRSLGNTREHLRGWQINTVGSEKRITTSHVTTQPTDINVRQPVGTELIQKKCIGNNSKGTA